MQKDMGFAKLQEAMIELHLKSYTKDEIQAMYDFYSSDAGQSIGKKIPEVAKESMVIGQQIAMDFMPKIQTIIDEIEKAK